MSFFSFGNEEEQLESWMLMLLLHFCGIITCQLWSVQLGFKDMGSDTLFFLLMNLQQVDNTFFLFLVGLLFLTNSFFLSFFQGPGMPEFNALLNTTYRWDDRVIS